MSIAFAKGSRGARFKRSIWERDGGACWSCKRPVPLEHVSLDHIIPRSKGGRAVAENLRCACWACNQYRGDVVTQADIDHAIRLGYQVPVWLLAGMGMT